VNFKNKILYTDTIILENQKVHFTSRLINVGNGWVNEDYRDDVFL